MMMLLVNLCLCVCISVCFSLLLCLALSQKALLHEFTDLLAFVKKWNCLFKSAAVILCSMCKPMNFPMS